MWKMLDSDFECGDECGGPGPPPEFLIPPPPRPPFLGEIIKCSEDNSNQFNSNGEICDAIPILDASYHSSPSLQTSALIILCSVILVLVILISSLLVWKHKRKVQNFLPCKTPTRGHPLDTTGVSGHSVTYEDPDAHLGHRPLVMRHHHNIEMIHPKAIHFPSGYPMTSSPPLFVCSSPGPDPYRSHDNVYEELGPPRDSDIESEPPLNSDDDFAEDELSLPGERSFQKAVSTTTPNNNSNGSCSNSNNINSNSVSINNCDNNNSNNNSNSISTICNSGSIVATSDPINCGESNLLERQLNERNALLNNNNNNNSIVNNNNSNNGSITQNSPIIFRNRKIYQQNDDHNTKTSSLKNNRDRIMTLPYRSNLLSNNNNISNNNNNSCNDNNNVSTIYRDHHANDRLLMLPPAPPLSQLYQNNTRSLRTINHHHPNNNNNNNNRIFFDRSLSNRLNYHHDDYLLEPNYDYTEPIYHHDGNVMLRLNGPPPPPPPPLPSSNNNNSIFNHHPHYSHNTTSHHHHGHHNHPYVLPEFTTFRTLNSVTTPSSVSHSPNAMIYSRDSSFGSDSGYSQHTQASSNRNGCNNNNNNSNNVNSNNNNNNSGGSSDRSFGGGIIGATFGWGRRSKDKSTNKNSTYDGS